MLAEAGAAPADSPFAGHLLDVRPLGRRRVFGSNDVEDARAFVARTLNEHRIEPGAGRFDMQMHRAEFPTITAVLLRYGSAVEIRTEALDRFLLVQMPLSGAIRIRYDGGELMATPRVAQVLPSRMPLRLNWTDDCTQMLLKVPMDRVTAVCGTLLGAPPSQPVRFRHDVHLDDPSGSRWLALVNLLLAQLDDLAGHPGHAAYVKQLEDALIGHLLCHQPNNYSARLSAGREPLAPRQVRAAEEFMRANLGNPITLNDMAAGAGVSVRTLCRLFRDCRGSSPMAVLRVARLEKVREELSRSGSRDSVTQVAMRWGFSHLGRFAAAYRERYGETPQATSRR